MNSLAKTLAWAQKAHCDLCCERNLDGTPCSHTDLCAALRLALQQVDRSVLIERPDLEEVRRSMVLLQMQAEHEIRNNATDPDWSLPGWLLDTKASLNDLTEALYPTASASDAPSAPAHQGDAA